SPLPGSGIYLSTAGQEYGGDGITISRKAGNLTSALAGLDSQLTRVSQSTQDFGAAEWILVIHSEPASGLEFFTALTEQSGTVIAVGSRNVPANVSAIEAM